MQVILTRPAAQSQAWADALVADGHRVVHLPLLEIRGIHGAQPTLGALKDGLLQAQAMLHSYPALMFVSSNAVEHFFKENNGNVTVNTSYIAIKNIVNSCNIRCWATGPGTVASLLAVGVRADLIDAPDAHALQFDTEHLWRVVASQIQQGSRLLIVRGAALQSDGSAVATGRDWLAHTAQSAGAQVEQVASYLRCPPLWTAQQRALAADAAGPEALWLFSSSEALAFLPQCMPTGFSAVQWAKARCVATHPRIADSARALGFGVVCTSRPDVGAVLASIKSLP